MICFLFSTVVEQQQQHVTTAPKPTEGKKNEAGDLDYILKMIFLFGLNYIMRKQAWHSCTIWFTRTFSSFVRAGGEITSDCCESVTGALCPGGGGEWKASWIEWGFQCNWWKVNWAEAWYAYVNVAVLCSINWFTYVQLWWDYLSVSGPILLPSIHHKGIPKSH